MQQIYLGASAEDLTVESTHYICVVRYRIGYFLQTFGQQSVSDTAVYTSATSADCVPPAFGDGFNVYQTLTIMTDFYSDGCDGVLAVVSNFSRTNWFHRVIRTHVQDQSNCPWRTCCVYLGSQ